MNSNQKAHLRNWEKTKKYKMVSGQEVRLTTIIADALSVQNRQNIDRPTTDSIPDLLNLCHPFFYYNYVINWAKIPTTKIPRGFQTGLEFGKTVVREWQQECWKMKYFNYDLLSNYDTIDRLRLATDQFLTAHGIDNLWYEAGYEALVDELYMNRQEQLDQEMRDYEAEQERLRNEKELALAENKAREAQQKADELRRLQTDRANKEQAERNRSFSKKENSPWSSSVSADAAKASPNTAAAADNAPAAPAKASPSTAAAADTAPAAPTAAPFSAEGVLTPSEAQSPSAQSPSAQSAFQSLPSIAALADPLFDHQPDDPVCVSITYNPSEDVYNHSVFTRKKVLVSITSSNLEHTVSEVIALLNERRDAEKKAKRQKEIDEQIAKLQAEMAKLEAMRSQI